MADRRTPNRKTPTEILADLVDGHREARIAGAARGQKYLQNFAQRNDSIPNAVKFFLYDLLAEDAFTNEDIATCALAVTNASAYLPAAQTELTQRFREYAASIRFFDRGITLAVDEGEFEKALALCDQAIAHNLGAAYAAKRASIDRML